MRFTSFRIRHYKSLDDVYMGDLGPTTLLVGTNAVGKSNVIDALRFLRDASQHSLDHAISSRGGLEIIRQYSPSKPYHIAMKVEFADYFSSVRRDGYGSYEMVISTMSGGNYRVEREEALWYEESPGGDLLEHTYSRGANGVVIMNGDKEDEMPPDELFVGRRFASVELRSILSAPRFSSIYPNTLRSPARPDTDRRLKETGENWASVLKAMRQTARGRQSFATILEMMKYVMPNLVDVKVKGVGGYLVPQFLVKDSEDAREHAFDPHQLSDGTLRIFGMLMALYQLPPSHILALEEPEQTINPAILSLLADAFNEVRERTQLFVTTHSPHLIDFFKPEQIRVVTMANGRTYVAPVRKSQILSIKEKLTTLEELMTQGNLHPEETS